MHSEALTDFKRWFQKSQLAARAYSCQKFAGSKQRVALFEAYGGSDWMTLLLALGAAGINEDLVECYNDEIDRRTPGGAHGVEPHFANCDRLSERSLAAARGEELPKVRGVHNKITETNQARRAAKLLDKQSQRCGNDQERQQLQKQDDDKWAEAALNEQAGHACTDRDGHRRFAETSQNCIVTAVLKAYAARRGLKYDCV